MCICANKTTLAKMQTELGRLLTAGFAGCGLRGASCGMRGAGRGVRVAGCGLRIVKKKDETSHISVSKFHPFLF